MRILLIPIIAILTACAGSPSPSAPNNDAEALRNAGVQAAANENFAFAKENLSRSAEMGYYTAQVELAYLLESSPTPVQDPEQAYVWYSVVIAREGSDTKFAKEGIARVSSKLDQQALKDAGAKAAEYVEKYGQKI